VDLPARIDSRLIGPVRNELEAARQDALRGIANTEAGRQILKALVQSDTFAPVGKPGIVARMYRTPDGLYLGHAKGMDGKIVGNASWIKISTLGSRLLTSAGMLTGHLMLVEISNKLDRVQVTLDAIFEALEDDRMQSLRAHIEGVKSALEANIASNRHALMVSTIPQLQESIHKMIAALKREIEEVPSPNEWKITDVIMDRQPEMRLKLSKAEKTFRACLEGISVLSQSYFALDEREIGCRSTRRLLRELQHAGTSDAEFKSRCLTPKNADDRPELLWTDFHRTLPELIAVIEAESGPAGDEFAEIDVEFLPDELPRILQALPAPSSAGEVANR
jgi:hypothetical protein